MKETILIIRKTFQVPSSRKETPFIWGIHLISDTVLYCCCCESGSVTCSVVSNSFPPVSSVLGILQARLLEWVAIPFSRGSPQPRGWTHVSSLAGRFFEPHLSHQGNHLAVVWLLLGCCCSVANLCLTFSTPRTETLQASLTFTISLSLLKHMSIQSVMPSNHPTTLWHPVLLLPSIFPRIRVFSNESSIHISIEIGYDYQCSFKGVLSLISVDWTEEKNEDKRWNFKRIFFLL